MVAINANLFAHIQNDASLSGTFGLEGNRFTNTAQYLKDYLKQLAKKGEFFPKAYSQLLAETDYMVAIEKEREAISAAIIKDEKPSTDTSKVAKKIYQDMLQLPLNGKLVLPGGWIGKPGHALVYQIIRKADGYEFQVINSGAGLHYHAKKSAQEKELYNPVKKWHFKASEEHAEETQLFFKQLLEACIPPSKDQYKPQMDADLFYQDTLASIARIDAVEIDANKNMKAHAYTGSQISGTCSQRSLHQMLKINTDNEADYKYFIFKFKMHALHEYADACFKKKQPFNKAVALQIRLAIENNLKILNSLPLKEEEIRHYAKDLSLLKARLNTEMAQFKEEAPLKTPKPATNFNIYTTANSNTPELNNANPDYKPAVLIPIDFNKGKDLLNNLDKIIKQLESVQDKATQYWYLEKILAALPLNLPLNKDSFYKELGSLEDYRSFEKYLNKIDDLLKSKQQMNPTPTANVMTLSLMSLQIDTHQAINQQSNLPNDGHITEPLIEALIGAAPRDPFWATNNPDFDARLISLQKRYDEVTKKDENKIIAHYKALINQDPSNKKALEQIYIEQFSNKIQAEFNRKLCNEGLESLYVISEMIAKRIKTPPPCVVLVKKVKNELSYAARLRKSFNHILGREEFEQPELEFLYEPDKELGIKTSLNFLSLLRQNINKNSCTKQKYLKITKAAKEALIADTTAKLGYSDTFASHWSIYPERANSIQLKASSTPRDSDKPQAIKQQDIIDRDYFHLRTVASLQIPLTLDYFTRNINLLTQTSDQQYVEANIFQPGLLIQASANPEFFSQLDNFLTTGTGFFMYEGQHTTSSLFFVHLNYQISHYLSLMSHPQAIGRLKALQQELLKQLQLPNSPEITYVLQQTLFLNLMTQVAAGAHSDELFALAFSAYFYIEGHSNPLLFDDPAQQMELEKAKVNFQQWANQQPENKKLAAVKEALKHSSRPLPAHYQLKGTYPIYQLVNAQAKPLFEVNAHLGLLFESGLAQTGVPLAIQNHPLIKHLKLDDQRQCLISADKKWLKIPPTGNSILFYQESIANHEILTASQEWTINNKTDHYELSALSINHVAYKSRRKDIVVNTNLPKILTDGSMDYWVNSKNKNLGILAQNKQGLYSVHFNFFKQLDAKGQETGYSLQPLSSQQLEQLSSFEDADFLIHHQSKKDSIILLPRYNLSFTQDVQSTTLIHQQTGERIVSGKIPIDQAVASLVLENDAQKSRCLIPIARFYASKEKTRESDFYPVVHDINGSIAQATMGKNAEGLWHYQNSESYASYQLKNGEPVADTVADALYLAYVYLSTNQTEKAWKILEECNTRFGGLTGTPEELKYISWIFKELPHILPDSKLEAARKNTPPFIACKLKAMSLLTNSLTQGKVFNLKRPDTKDKDLHSQYALSQHQDIEEFLKELPATLYHTFMQLQKVRRHLESPYQLSFMERKHLLNYYQQSQSLENTPAGALIRAMEKLDPNSKPQDLEEPPKGALGYEMMSLNLEMLLKEEAALVAREKIQALLPGEKKRLDFVRKQLQELKPITAISTELELLPINLQIPDQHNIVSYQKTVGATWSGGYFERLPVAPLDEKQLINALNELLSDREDHIFLSHFPAYFQIALSDNEAQITKLLHFCTRTLIAKRHIPLKEQNSNIPFLCNILYRVLTNKQLVIDELKKDTLNFEKLRDKVKVYEVPPLKVYQAKDVYKDILAKPEQMAQQKPLIKPLLNPEFVSQTLIAQTGLLSFLSPEQNQQIQVMLNQCQTLQDKNRTYFKTQSALKDKDPYILEEEAGLFRLQQTKALQQIATPFINNPQLSQSTIAALNKAETTLAPLITKAWEDALTLANQGPQESIAARKWKLEIEANARAKLTKADLLALYSRADTANSIEKTGLSAQDCQKLHELIHHALVQGIQANWLIKIKNSLDTAIKEKDAHSAAQALDLLARKEIPGLDDQATILIQHEQAIILHQRQADSLKALIERPNPPTGKPFKELIDKTIPGGGKSKVILPIIAEKKADGSNMVVIEVPRALLATNFVDLNRESQRLFGKPAYKFEFNRDSDISPKRLKQYYEQFREVITNKAYLVTCGEAIQSLELKYLELLVYEGKKNSTWEKQVFWLDKITNLFLHQADCIIDEAHKGLSIKDKLNYTTGVAQPISKGQIQNAIALYNLIDLEFIKNAPSFKPDYDWQPFQKQLAERLVKEQQSPLAAFVLKARAQYGVIIDEILIAYLNNQAKDLHEVITTASPEIKASLAFFKQEISLILPQTLPRKLEVHYGASQLKDLSLLDKTFPIPYDGNGIPNERSRFGNTIETSNYLIQMMLIKGLSQEQVSEQILIWQAEARQELLQNPAISSIDDSMIARTLALLTPKSGLKLSQINVHNPVHLHSLHRELQHNSDLINQWLKPSLKQIKNDAGIIQSDSFNHADLYRTTQGVTGTPNPTTYHQRLAFDNSASLGTDGFVINIILDKKTITNGCDCKDINQFLDQVLSPGADHSRCRAIIDINATFKGLSNYKVATALAAFSLNHPERFSQTIKHILYFNEANVLCAIKPQSPHEPMVIGTSDPEEINRLLGSKPDERFTYYDQVHTVGVDIKQSKKSHALVLVDDKTSLQSFIQGTMRMRELALEQSLELVVPERNKDMDSQQLIKKFTLNDKNELNQANLSAAKGQLKNCIRRNLLTRIQDLPSENAQEKAILSKHFKSFFIDQSSEDLFALYGHLSKERASAEILNHGAIGLLRQWKKCLENAGIALPQAEQNTMEADLKKIINQALPHCLAHYQEMDDSLALRVEVQKEVQTEVQQQIQLLNLNEFYNEKLQEHYGHTWQVYNLFNPLPWKDLNEQCGLEENTALFSTRLSASPNYFQTYNNQSKMMDSYLKPIFLVWYHYSDEGKFQAMIINPTELEDLIASNYYKQRKGWISTTQDTLIAGEKPADFHSLEDYKSLREQIRFFNGEFNLLANQKTPLIWLKEKTAEKLKFYEDKLLSYRPLSSQSFGLMKTSLNQNEAIGFNYIVSHPFTDLREFNWHNLNPHLLELQTTQYQKLAQVFYYLNKHWMTLPDDPAKILNTLQAKFQIPLSSLSQVSSHLQNLLQLNKIMTLLTTPSDKPFLHNPTINPAFFKDFLGIPVASILQQYSITQPAPESLLPKQLINYQLASMQLLLALRLHPVIDDKKALDEIIITAAKHSNSVEMLRLLAEISNPPLELLKAILKSPFCDASVIKLTLQIASEEVLIQLINHGNPNASLLEAIIRHPQCTDKVLESLSQKALLTIPLANKIIEQQLQKVYPALSTRLVEIITTNYKNTQPNSLWEDTFKKVLAHKFPTIKDQEIIIEFIKEKGKNFQDKVIKLEKLMALTPLINSFNKKEMINAMFLLSQYNDEKPAHDYLLLVEKGATDQAQRLLDLNPIRAAEIAVLQKQCEDLIKNIHAHSWGAEDTQTSDYCEAMQASIDSIKSDELNPMSTNDKFVFLSHQLMQLKVIQASVTSTEMNLLRLEMERLNKGASGLVDWGYKNKIQEINKAVMNVPLEKRAHIFSQEKDAQCNLVRKALAIKRVSFFTAIDSKGQVDPNKAATSFKNIKKALQKDNGEAENGGQGQIKKS